MNKLTTLQTSVAAIDLSVVSVEAQNQMIIWLQSVLSAYFSDQISNPQAGGLTSLATLVTTLQAQVASVSVVETAQQVTP